MDHEIRLLVGSRGGEFPEPEAAFLAQLGLPGHADALGARANLSRLGEHRRRDRAARHPAAS